MSTQRNSNASARLSDFVLDKDIFANVFEKDIKRVYLYKKAERLAKAIRLITPAFKNAPVLRDRIDLITMGLIDAAILSPAAAREALSRELLALSSILSIARTGGLLSDMNADLITHEAHLLLGEIAGYEEPRLFLEQTPSLAELARRAPSSSTSLSPERSGPQKGAPTTPPRKGQLKGHISDTTQKTDRRDTIISVLRAKGPSRIKDISTVIRDISEKTIQRELQTLVQDGQVTRTGERRWTVYALA